MISGNTPREVGKSNRGGKDVSKNCVVEQVTALDEGGSALLETPGKLISEFFHLRAKETGAFILQLAPTIGCGTLALPCSQPVQHTVERKPQAESCVCARSRQPVPPTGQGIGTAVVHPQKRLQDLTPFVPGKLFFKSFKIQVKCDPL